MKEVNKKHLTPWFDGKKYTPARPGVYMQRCGYGKDVGYQRWDGSYWYGWCYRAEDAAKQIVVVDLAYQNDDWRGLREGPK